MPPFCRVHNDAIGSIRNPPAAAVIAHRTGRYPICHRWPTKANYNVLCSGICEPVHAQLDILLAGVSLRGGFQFHLMNHRAAAIEPQTPTPTGRA
jgi:hypothetical protein